MKQFWKLNAVSMLYALMIAIPVELMLNVYRISRVGNMEIGTVNSLTGIILLLEMTLGTLLFYKLIQKWLGRKNSNYWTVILWLPYFVLYLYGFATLFPISYGGDMPNPASGLMIIAGLFVYPFYILILTSAALPIDYGKKDEADSLLN
ncbi:hypothetical protein BN1080_02399 [Planococcus massiliensis]|uniref:Uncharacterized protein n=1 Tax=Planococcus massiliensis TaxID=1499687 RepID=A0A098EMB1_9BACL|nr:hypothetical protein [Planococcus massiliensis]CEG23423.1 hypothetical protein BN1080_02399 [Planococcus massiliensis]